MDLLIGLIHLFLLFYFNNFLNFNFVILILKFFFKFIIISFSFFFLPFLLSHVVDRVLVLWPGDRPEPLRWEG